MALSICHSSPPSACALRIRRLPTSVGVLEKQHDQRRLVVSLIYLSQFWSFQKENDLSEGEMASIIPLFSFSPWNIKN
jgi:hypothetical protein